jgi:hypothetical protein
MWKVVVYTVFNTKKTFEVDSREKAREYAMRIIREGLWFTEDEREQREVFYPVANVVKVVIVPA